MRLHRFYIQDEINGREVVIKNKDLLHQWKNVFRLNVGSQVILFNGDGKEYRATLSKLDYYDTRALVLEVTENETVSKKVLHVYTSLIKKINSNGFLKKGTELGVLHFHPILSERSEKKKTNEERAHKIIIEAVEQSGRATIPTLHPLLTLEEALTQNPINPFVLHMEGVAIRDVIQDKTATNDLSIFIGPEGGFSDKEVALFREKNIPMISLGKAVLKAETATIAVSALLL